MNKKTLLFFLLALPGEIFSQYQNVQVSNPNNSDPNEISITVNPMNPANIAAGANINYYYYSTNSGLSWTQGNLTSSLTVWGDPALTYDVSGHLYFGHLTNPAGPAFIDRIVVQKSTNGGVSWNDGVGIGLNLPKQQDKEWLAVDMTNSIYRNNIYMAWTEFDAYGSSNPVDSSRILFSRSTNAGLSWTSPIKISDVSGDCIDDDNTVEGAVPAVGPNGEVYTSWAGPLGIMFDRSLDGGASFGQDIFVTSQPGGWGFDVSGTYRSNGLPVTACDVSNSLYHGHVYVMWADQRNGTSNTDVFITKSTDGGDTWGSPVKVNNDNSNRDQFFPWMAIDQSTGYIYVVFYDRRNTSGDATEVWMAKSTNGGSSFTNFKVSESAFTPNQQVFFGDYNGIAAMNGKVYPIWMRMVNSSRSIWTALVNDNPVVTRPIGDTTLSKNFGKIFMNKLSSVFSDNDNPALTFSVSNLSAGVTAAISHDSLYLTSDNNFSGNVDFRVTASDGRLSVSDTFLVNVSPFTPAQIFVGALASPVVSLVRFAVGADSILNNVSVSVNSQPITMKKEGGLYFGDYPISTIGNLSVNVQASDIHMYSTGLNQNYQVALFEKIIAFESYKIRGKGNGYLLLTKKKIHTFPENWLPLGSMIEWLSTGGAMELEIEMNYSDAMNTGSDPVDEAKIGLYQWTNDEWRYVGGEGRNGSVSAKITKADAMAVFYNPSHKLIPKEFTLSQNYPNPFNPSTTIKYEIPVESRVTIKVYNLLGQEVKTLVNSTKSIGRYEVEWDGKNDSGREVASGLYLYRLETDNIHRTLKMLLIK